MSMAVLKVHLFTLCREMFVGANKGVVNKKKVTQRQKFNQSVNYDHQCLLARHGLGEAGYFTGLYSEASHGSYANSRLIKESPTQCICGHSLGCLL